ncbi:MAG: SDR family oxidoreductase [Bacteroidota bacterium]|nr:SDR family oxidoreductase [Bacteroidota bacterium]MDP4204386.1 SDR family oxidoreductase [Bacteroidota bacterium]
MTKVILVTGVSSGFGRQIAKILSETGYNVYGTSRRDIDPLPNINLLKMDVTDENSVKAGVEQILAKEGKIDILVNNAGMGISGAIEDSSAEEIKLQMDTNFMGAVHTIQAVLPSMRNQKSGTIINISSVGGLMGLPFQGFYSASKYAIEGMSEALSMELRAFNINVVLINPGDFRTNFTANRRIIQKAQKDSAYNEQFEKTLKIIEKDENGGLSPEVLAKKICQIVKKKKPCPRYVIASFEQKLAVVLKRILPDALYNKMLEGHYGIH